MPAVHFQTLRGLLVTFELERDGEREDHELEGAPTERDPSARCPSDQGVADDDA